MSHRSRSPSSVQQPGSSPADQVHVWANLETCHVLLCNGSDVEWAQTTAGYGRKDCVKDLAEGQFPEAVAVFCSHDGRFDDVSAALAHLVLERIIETGETLDETPPPFVERHINNLGLVLEEARHDTACEAAHRLAERSAPRL